VSSIYSCDSPPHRVCLSRVLRFAVRRPLIKLVGDAIADTREQPLSRSDAFTVKDMLATSLPDDVVSFLDRLLATIAFTCRSRKGVEVVFCGDAGIARPGVPGHLHAGDRLEYSISEFWARFFQLL
jgi:hypothetical protein